MEFSDIRLETCEDKGQTKANVYENTSLSTATGETGKNKELYDQSNLSIVTSGRKDVDKEPKCSPNRTKILVYSILVMLVLLYIAVIVLIVIISLPKKNQVNGSWSTWSSWGPCSVSCDVGTQYRSRSCSDSYAIITGDHCFGESRDDRICLPGACSDGGWSSWGSWGTCSESCGGGIRSQTRTCTNPKPSLLGKSCDGTPIQVSVCNRHVCSDGGWSSWSSWGTCSESCGGGIRSQTRTCTNPKPSLRGKQCEGNSVKDSICNKQICPQHKVAFTAYGISGSSFPIFPHVVMNNGNGYNISTGKFTCKIPGIYIFSFQISKKYNVTADLVSCFLRKNSDSYLGAIQDPVNAGGSENEKDGYSLSLSGAFHLNQNDTVSVGSCSGISTVYTDYRSSFTGVLVTPDN